MPTSLHVRGPVARDAFGCGLAPADLTEAWSSMSILFRDSSADVTRIPGEGRLAHHLRRLTTSRFRRSKPYARQCSLAPDPSGTPRPRLGTPLRMARL